ncbi:hypothetical protein JM654_22515 [Microbacterium oxydans]|nr:hypothetical protein [Microbacterium oxydans]
MSSDPQRTIRHPVTPRIASSRRFSASTTASADIPVRNVGSRYFPRPSNSPNVRAPPKGEVERVLLAVRSGDARLQIDLGEPETVKVQTTHALSGQLSAAI